MKRAELFLARGVVFLLFIIVHETRGNNLPRPLPVKGRKGLFQAERAVSWTLLESSAMVWCITLPNVIFAAGPPRILHMFPEHVLQRAFQVRVDGSGAQLQRLRCRGPVGLGPQRNLRIRPRAGRRRAKECGCGGLKRGRPRRVALAGISTLGLNADILLLNFCVAQQILQKGRRAFSRRVVPPSASVAAAPAS